MLDIQARLTLNGVDFVALAVSLQQVLRLFLLRCRR